MQESLLFCGKSFDVTLKNFHIKVLLNCNLFSLDTKVLNISLTFDITCIVVYKMKFFTIVIISKRL